MSNGKLLLADNVADYRSSLLPLLRQEGYEVEEADSVESAMKKLETTPPVDLALVDLRLTDDGDDYDISGLEVARRAREQHIPPIIITAFATVEMTREALRARGADLSLAEDYVPKVSGPDSVLDVVRSCRGLSLLHISDLHLEQREGEDPIDLRGVRETLANDVAKRPGLEFSPLRAIVVSGDIGYKCRPDSFDRAFEFLKELADDLHVPLDRVILSPGNHDVNRAKARKVKNHLEARNRGNHTWFSKFDRYLQFSQEFYSEPAFTEERLYRVFVIDDRLAIVSFNSCLVEGDLKYRCKARTCEHHSHYSGWVGRNQVVQAAGELQDDALRVAVCHHHVVSEDWASRSSECKGDHLMDYHHPDHRLKFVLGGSGFRILLHGHAHKPGARREAAWITNLPLTFGTGALWPSGNENDESAGYLLLQLSPVRGQSRVTMRKYLPATDQREGYWTDDDFLGPNNPLYLPPEIVLPSRAAQCIGGP